MPKKKIKLEKTTREETRELLDTISGNYPKKNVFKCPGCSTIHLKRSEAIDCCRGEELSIEKTAYECPKCKTLHKNEEKAISCCIEEKIKTINGFECTYCKEVYEKKSEAMACCIEDKADKMVEDKIKYTKAFDIIMTEIDKLPEQVQAALQTKLEALKVGG